MIDADTVEAVWNQAHGVVQLFVNDALLMAMPQAQAREMANALLAAARVPDLARAMLDDGPTGIASSDPDNWLARFLYTRFPTYHPLDRNTLLSEHYARD